MVKNPPANAGDIRDAGLIPGSEGSPGGGHGNSLQYSCLQNPLGRVRPLARPRVLVLVLVLLLDAAEARRPAAALGGGGRPVGALGVEEPAQRGAGQRGGGGAPGAEVLLAHVARVALALQALEVGEGRQRGLAEQAGQGARLVSN